MKESELLNQIEEVLKRGVGEFIDPDGSFKNKLIQKVKGDYKKDIIIKFGVDPTRPDIHLGHAAVFKKLRKFQELGCKVVFLVGDFTAQIGDPTGKNKVRPEIEQEEIQKNMQTYLDQVGKILLLDKEVFSWIRNSDWFTAITDLTFPEGQTVNLNVKQGEQETNLSIDTNSFIGKALMFEKTRMQIKDLGLSNKVSVVTLRSFIWGLKHITFAQLIERDMFQERLKNHENLYMHEMVYPILQGIDSQILNEIYGSCDMEIGGTDQIFNMLLGRDMMRINHQSPQAVLAVEILEGLDGKNKMSKSLDNYVAINDTPENMYGKIMSIPDTLILSYYKLCTYTPAKEIELIKKELDNSKNNPRDIKMKLAHEVVSIYHGENKAKQAEEFFINVFQKKEIPDIILEIYAEVGQSLSDVLIKEKIVKSKSDLRRLIDEKAVHNLETKELITDLDLKLSQVITLKIGKKRFVKIFV